MFKYKKLASFISATVVSASLFTTLESSAFLISGSGDDSTVTEGSLRLSGGKRLRVQLIKKDGSKTKFQMVGITQNAEGNGQFFLFAVNNNDVPELLVTPFEEGVHGQGTPLQNPYDLNVIHVLIPDEALVDAQGYWKPLRMSVTAVTPNGNTFIIKVEGQFQAHLGAEIQLVHGHIIIDLETQALEGAHVWVGDHQVNVGEALPSGFGDEQQSTPEMSDDDDGSEVEDHDGVPGEVGIESDDEWSYHSPVTSGYQYAGSDSVSSDDTVPPVADNGYHHPQPNEVRGAEPGFVAGQKFEIEKKKPQAPAEPNLPCYAAGSGNSVTLSRSGARSFNGATSSNTATNPYFPPTSHYKPLFSGNTPMVVTSGGGTQVRSLGGNFAGDGKRLNNNDGVREEYFRDLRLQDQMHNRRTGLWPAPSQKLLDNFRQKAKSKNQASQEVAARYAKEERQSLESSLSSSTTSTYPAFNDAVTTSTAYTTSSSSDGPQPTDTGTLGYQQVAGGGEYQSQSEHDSGGYKSSGQESDSGANEGVHVMDVAYTAVPYPQASSAPYGQGTGAESANTDSDMSDVTSTAASWGSSVSQAWSSSQPDSTEQSWQSQSQGGEWEGSPQEISLTPPPVPLTVNSSGEETSSDESDFPTVLNSQLDLSSSAANSLLETIAGQSGVVNLLPSAGAHQNLNGRTVQ